MALTPARLLPDATTLVLEVLRTAGVGASSEFPKNIIGKMPWWFVAYRIGGTAPHPQFLDRATMQVQAYAATDDEACKLAETGRVLLFQAWREQYSSAAGVVHKFAEVAAPFPLPSGVDGVWRYDATYSIWVRPAQG